MSLPVQHGERQLGLLLLPVPRDGQAEQEAPDPDLVRALCRHIAIALEFSGMQGELVAQERLAAIGETIAGLAHCLKNALNALRAGLFITDRALVSGDTNSARDVFLAHTSGGTETVRVSLDNAGHQVFGPSSQAQISRDGRLVIYESQAVGLVSQPVNAFVQLYVRDLAGGTNTLVSVSSDGSLANDTVQDGAMSRDGRVVAFATISNNLIDGDTNQRSDLFVLER